MRSHIDWLTFTMPMVYFGQEENSYALAIQAGFMDMFEADDVATVFGGAWAKNERSRAPYTDSWRDAEGGISLFASPNLVHCCVEISGQGCERLIGMGKMDTILRAARERVTRIDIAVDIETSTMPHEFVKETSHERMRTSGQVISDTGETCYVGSQKSERYARVYRYNKPHPRAHLLRVEHVFRKAYAKKVAEALATGDIQQITKSSGDAFGWCHQDWKVGTVDGADISVVKERGGSGGTIFWLVHSVAPAFKKLVETGAISSPEEFLKQFFLDNDA